MELENEVPKDSNYPGRKQRTMSCPARVTVPGEQLRLGSWPNIGGFTELRRDFFPTIKTLSMLFIYLLMSSPLCIMTAIFSDCRCQQKSKDSTITKSTRQTSIVTVTESSGSLTTSFAKKSLK